MSKSKTPIAAKSAKSLTDFQKAHDANFIVPERFRAGIKALGSEGWAYLGDFARDNHINPAQSAAYREQFAEFLLTADKKMVICGSAKLATKLRAMV